jgi:uncharacterized protein YoxC
MESNMSIIEIASLIASFMSVALAILAIWLSVVFYKMSSQLSESTKEAAKGIAANVERLEKLFDKLYSDTFSIMKDTVSDMRRHIWPEESKDTIAEEVEKKADIIMDELKESINLEITNILERQHIVDAKMDGISHKIENLLDKAINESRKVDVKARGETIREHIIRMIHYDPSIRIGKIVSELIDKYDFSKEEVAVEIFRMRTDGIVTWDGVDSSFSHNQRIKLMDI